MNTCIFISGVGPWCGFISFTHTPWAPVEPNANEAPSEGVGSSPLSTSHRSADHPKL